jgi:predicted AAA+ superfamily ATPase
MKYIPRQIESELLSASRHFSGLILTGPRRAGKTTLLRKLFPKAQYYLLEDPDIIARLRADPQSSLSSVKSGLPL